jgi:MFS family permease
VDQYDLSVVSMNSVGASREAQRLLTASIVARLPQEMLGVGLLLQTQQLTGSFAQAGVVAGTYAIALGVGGPLLGQVVDRRGQTVVLLATASIGCALLVTTAMLPRHTALALLVLLAAGAGLATPPVGACLRAQLPSLLSTTGDVRRAYALEASLVELTYIFGPPLALSVAALRSAAAAVALAGLGLLLATTAFAGQPASRTWRPAPVDRGVRGGVLRPPAMRTLAIVLMAVGMLLGADEVAVIAAAKELHSTIAAAPLFAVWGVGSFIGGLVLTRCGGGPRTAAGLALLLGALTVGHLALIPADGKALALGAVLLIAGATIAPTESTLYAMVGQAAPAGAITEAFAWLATAMAVGGAAGSAGAGLLADRAGPSAAFALAGGAGALALLASLLNPSTLPFPRRAPKSPRPGRHPEGEPDPGDTPDIELDFDNARGPSGSAVTTRQLQELGYDY